MTLQPVISNVGTMVDACGVGIVIIRFQEGP